MTHIQTIIVPVDLGPPSEHALAFALDLAETYGARVHVILAYQLPIYGFPDGVMVATANHAAQMSEAAQSVLDGIVDKQRRPRVEMTKQLLQGDPREVILATANELRADLIVMGTHGRKGIARALIGSVAEAVVRASEVPVVTVH